MLLLSCYSYEVIRTEEHLDRNAVTAKRIQFNKYFARITSCSEHANINNQGVALSLKGKFKKAEKFFKKAVTIDKDEAAPYNNLGVIYEMQNHRKKAFAMYSKACILESGNLIFKRNFLSFVDKHNNE